MAEKAVNGRAADEASGRAQSTKARTAAKPAAKPAGKTAGNTDTSRRIQVRRSGVHGKGVFAVQNIAEGETIIEYVGEVITWKEALRRHPHDPKDPNHTFYFHIDEERVIDAKYGGNSSRWINHSCDPNCEADEEDGRVFVKALRNIKAGEELNYDYGLIIDEPYTKKLKAEYPCWCGAKLCRGTLLAPKRRQRR
jgi:SET domain-containing protein